VGQGKGRRRGPGPRVLCAGLTQMDRHPNDVTTDEEIATSQGDRELVARRLKDAIEDYEERYGKGKG